MRRNWPSLPPGYRQWIEIGIRSVNGKLGAEIGVDYADPFRYEYVEAPEFFSSTDN